MRRRGVSPCSTTLRTAPGQRGWAAGVGRSGGEGSRRRGTAGGWTARTPERWRGGRRGLVRGNTAGRGGSAPPRAMARPRWGPRRRSAPPFDSFLFHPLFFLFFFPTPKNKKLILIITGRERGAARACPAPGLGSPRRGARPAAGAPPPSLSRLPPASPAPSPLLPPPWQSLSRQRSAGHREGIGMGGVIAPPRQDLRRSSPSWPRWLCCWHRGFSAASLPLDRLAAARFESRRLG